MAARLATDSFRAFGLVLIVGASHYLDQWLAFSFYPNNPDIARLWFEYGLEAYQSAFVFALLVWLGYKALDRRVFPIWLFACMWGFTEEMKESICAVAEFGHWQWAPADQTLCKMILGSQGYRVVLLVLTAGLVTGVQLRWKRG